MLVVHHRSPGDDSQMRGIEVSELADHLFGQPVAEIFLPRISGEILKGQNGYHDSARLLSRAASRTPWPNDIHRDQDERDGGGGDNDRSPMPRATPMRVQLNFSDTSRIDNGHTRFYLRRLPFCFCNWNQKPVTLPLHGEDVASIGGLIQRLPH